METIINAIKAWVLNLVSKKADKEYVEELNVVVSSSRPDMGVNNTQSLSYVKNRPMYYTDEEEDVVIEGTIAGLFGIPNAFIPGADLIIGSEYKIIISETAVLPQWRTGVYARAELDPDVDMLMVSFESGQQYFRYYADGTVETNVNAHSEFVHITITGKVHKKKKASSFLMADDYLMRKNNPTATGRFVMNNYYGSLGSMVTVEGYGNAASGEFSHVEGYTSTASGDSSHAECTSTASGEQSHSEGRSCHAAGDQSHAEGRVSSAPGNYSHAEGYHTTSSGETSHAEGTYTLATHKNQHVQGAYNIADPSTKTGDFTGTYAHIVGNGASANNRSNAHTLDWQGNAWFAGDIYVGSTSGTNKDEGSKKVATEDFVAQAIAALRAELQGG